MRDTAKHKIVVTALTVLLAGSATADRVSACGGFFCQLVPIDQAGEQIIFRQEGDMVTAVVLIQYAGAAEDFSWVVPVPGVPELSTGSDLVFSPLELATRPQFILETTGEPCPNLDGFGGFGSAPLAGGSDNAANEDSGVEVLQTLVVGPFDVQIVASDDPDALAVWLEENNYDLSDRGRDLIAPYVEEEMNFVALRLRQDQGVGDLQPLIMRYVSDEPMIPIRLTAVAAQRDMGVIVWLLGGSRAVPLNYLHVTPNYTRLNWYAGTFNAYVSYQGLITAAMDEAGGRGFATDYAGRSLDFVSRLPTTEPFENELIRLSAIDDDAEFINQAAGGFVFPPDKVLEILRRVLPLPEGEGEFLYQIPDLLTEVVTVEDLAAARTAVLFELADTVIDPLVETLALFDGDPYMTRLYTTLSPEEMTVDPIFSFNPDLADQALDRSATLDVECVGLTTRWSLKLGRGTDRDGEVVIEGMGDPPGFFGPPPTVDQDAIFRTEMVTTTGPPEVVTQKQFPLLQLNGDGSGTGPNLCGLGTDLCGSGIGMVLIATMFGLRLMRSRQ